MKNRILMFLVIAIFIMASSCGQQVAKSPQVSVVLIIGNHANAKTFNSVRNNADLIRLLDDAVGTYVDSDALWYSELRMSVIVSDGSPQPIEYDGRTESDASEENIINWRSLLPGEALDSFMGDTYRANDAEVDLLYAITRAKNHLDQQESSLEKHIVIIDTGLSTTGKFDMTTNDIMQGSVEDVIGRIDEGAFPDLSDINVSFYGLGDVGYPQDDISNNNEFQKRLVDIWTHILGTECKAKLVSDIKFSTGQGTPRMNYEVDLPEPEEGNDYTAHLNQYDDYHPPVKSVTLIEPKPTPSPTPKPTPTPEVQTDNTPKQTPTPTPSPKPAPNTVIYDNLGFLAPNPPSHSGDKFRDEAYAINYIEKTTINGNLLDYLEYYPERKVYVVGSIATVKQGVEYRTDAVSAARANRVANIIIGTGISLDQVKVIDAGTTDFSWRCAEEFPNGEWSSTEAQKNRVVAVICEDEKNVALLDELRSKGYID